ncbi:NlpC/P60 family protein [Micromonospora sp. WMMD714]|uniref:C40 family peptidase n=1 Tax=Micromonospora sp. WMMD714 TaxID=3016097 RepID=UPI00249C8A18|nr:NlpC/P60 family protein [Micromonospora sp. WMMD714]WFE66935.1 NlpC/P60 family protein [Micromonospora sp. WMMD714]
MELEPGREALVRVAVATLWTDPAATRPVDRPALAVPSDTDGWITGMDAAQRVGDCVLSQLLLGERVLVTAVLPGGWAEVVAVEQAAPRRDPRGYPGWLPTAQLAPAPPTRDRRAGDPPAPLVVDAVSTDLCAAPGGPVALPGVVLGTRLPPLGPAVGGWRPVRVPGRPDPLWVPEVDVAGLPAVAPSADDVLAVAARLRDVAYVWGGLSGHGIDCSGLVHLAWRRFGVPLPRDADDQAAVTTPVPAGEERPGDLYFFARPGRGIHHVGLVTAGSGPRMLHACYRQQRVLAEPLPPDRVATLVGAHRV